MTRRVQAAPRGALRAVATGFGWCWASRSITHGDELVGCMFRVEPSDDDDSGWRFFASPDASDDPRDHARFDVNVIANLDPNIVPHLHAPVGTTYRWSAQADAYIESEEWT